MTQENSLYYDYFNYQIDSENKYGKGNTLVLMQVGSFYEAYNIIDKGYDLNKLSDILSGFRITKKQKDKDISIKNPLLLGFPDYTLNKNIKILLDNNLIVVIVDQVTEAPNPKRQITNIYSPGSYIDNITTQYNNNIISIYIEEFNHEQKQILIFGITSIDLSTGDVLLYQIEPKIQDIYYNLEEVEKFINYNNVKEIIVISKDLNIFNINDIINRLNIYNKCKQIYTFDQILSFYPNINKLSAHKTLLDDIYNMKNSIIDLKLDNIYYARLSFIILLNYINEYNKILINKLKKPDIYISQNYLYLGNNALFQLNIFNQNIHDQYSNNTKFKSLIDVIDKTKTPMGKRFLKQNIINPILDIDELNNRYNIINIIMDNDYKNIEKILQNIKDIERHNRKIYLLNINPKDLYLWYNYILSIHQLIQYNQSININQLDDKYIIQLKKLMNYFKKTFNYDILNNFHIDDINTNIFNIGIYNDIDQLQNQINQFNDDINIYCKQIDDIISDNINDQKNKKNKKNKQQNIIDNEESGFKFIKFCKNDDECYIQMTKKRTDLLKQNKQLKFQLKFKEFPKSNNVKIFSDQLTKLYDQFLQNTSDIKKIITEYYIQNLSSINDKYSDLLDKLSYYTGYYDFLYSGAKIAQQYNYCKPIINNFNNDISYISAKQLRHPIIERINIHTEYKPFDISLDQECKGILLFGLNSAGKSTLQKSIGINLILAQIGYYCSSNHFQYYPFNSLMTRISGNDNIFKGKSSFDIEMDEINSILKRSDNNTLVIADELCRGTEVKSSVIIVTSILDILINNNTRFITATHLHELSKINRLKNIKELKFNHIHVTCDIDNKNIIYDRQLKDGSGDDFYGLFVSQILIDNDKYLQLSNKIKNELNNNKLIPKKQSRYNSNLYMKKCFICHYQPVQDEIPLETHHINFQKDCDKNGFINNKQHKHKNHITNLCVLCYKCHDMVDDNIIIIKGYIETQNGLILDYRFNRDPDLLKI